MVCLDFFFIGYGVCLHSMDCCFDSGVTCNTHVSSPWTMWLKKSSPCSLYRVRKVNALACRFILCSSVSIFGTQREHNFRKRIFSDNFVKKWLLNLWKMQGKRRNGESSVLLNLLFHCTHKVFIKPDGRPLRGLSSCTFSRPSLKCLTPSPYQWITHDKFSILLTKLTMNVSRFHVRCIQEADYRPHFTCSGLLDFLERCKHIGRGVNVVLLSANCVRAFQKNQKKICTHAHYSDRSVAAAMFANGSYFVDTLRTSSDVST
jgi:hypothetical protein